MHEIVAHKKQKRAAEKKISRAVKKKYYLAVRAVVRRFGAVVGTRWVAWAAQRRARRLRGHRGGGVFFFS